MSVRYGSAERPSLASTSARGDRRADDPPVGPYGIFAMAAGVAFLLAGVAWPQAAEGLLRLLLATLALGFVIARAYEAMMPVRTREDSGSPFDGDAAVRPPPTAPHVLRRLTADLGAADDDRRARRTAIPRSVRWAVIDEASRRLGERHGLNIDERSDHAEIRALVSEPTWSLVGPRSRGAVTLTDLDRILDDLERL